MHWQTAPVSLFAHTFYTSIPVGFPLHPEIRSASVLKAISQSRRFTEGFPHIQTAMSQMDAAFMQIWKGPKSRCCWGRTLLVDFSMFVYSESDDFGRHALLCADPCFIWAQWCLIVTSYGLDVSSAYAVMDNDVTEAFKRCLWTVETAAFDSAGFYVAKFCR